MRKRLPLQGVVLMAACSVALSAPSRAQDLPAPVTPEVEQAATATESANLLTVSTNGFLDSRFSYTHVATDHLLPSNDVPALANLTEANVQLKLRWPDRAEGLADASFLYQHGGLFYGQDATGQELHLADHDVPALHPAAILSEFYGTLHLSPHADLTLGKKRVVWGPGLSINPTDLLNPPKDPSDPALQRAGAWLGRLELPYDQFTLTFLAVLQVTRQYGGVPAALAWYPDSDKMAGAFPAGEDDRPHFATAVRGYLLWHETDINAIWYMSQLYNDAFAWKNRFGLTASHVFWNSVEFHVEALLQTGSARRILPAAFGSTFMPSLFPLLDDGVFRPRILAGARYMFGDAASVSLEYLYQGDGYDQAQFDNYARTIKLLNLVGRIDPPLDQMLQQIKQRYFGTSADPGSPQRFAFDPLRRHYALLTYQQSQIADDWTVMGLVLLDLHDLSGQVAPTVTWSVREWLNLTAAAFITLPGVRSLGADVDGSYYTEFGIVPVGWRMFVSARVFY